MEFAVDIKLTFVNQSNNTKNAQYVIFQKNIARGADHRIVAWHVIKECGKGDTREFTLPTAVSVGASREMQREPLRMMAQLAPIDAEMGALYGVSIDTNEPEPVRKIGYASSIDEIQIRNDSRELTLSGDILKNGQRLITAQLKPGETAGFQVGPTLWIGVSRTAVQGWEISATELSDLTEIPLLGIRSADIVATGGGPDDAGIPVQFGLADVVR